MNARILAPAASLLALIGLACIPPAQGGTTPEPEVFGWVERVELLDGKISLKTKLDTGALTSSLDATEIERFERNGERWVAFTVTDDTSDHSLRLERPLVRNVRIVQHDGESQRRPVVSLPVCFGEFHDELEFSLIDRSNFIYPVLLGRRALEGRALVDSAATFSNYPACDYRAAAE